MKNAAFNQKLKKDGKSIYAISRMTGIPYTTISELANNKNNINKCSYETVNKLAAYFRCNASEITNPIQYIENVHGTYRKIPYKWIMNNGVEELHISDNKKDIVLLCDDKMTQARFSREYFATTLCYIDIYLKKKEAHALLCHSADTH